jgi:O-antigen biosynthesis protein
MRLLSDVPLITDIHTSNEDVSRFVHAPSGNDPGPVCNQEGNREIFKTYPRALSIREKIPESLVLHMELSVVIVSFNVRDYLKQCLLSAREAMVNIDCEIFVVDNNSSDDSCSMVKSEFPEVILINNHDNRGFSAANNQAIRLARGRYVLVLNPDTVVERDTFIRSIAFMDDHPDAAALGVKMTDGQGRFLPESKRGIPTPATAFFKISGLSYLFPRSPFINRYYLSRVKNHETARTEIIAGAYMFIRREALEKTGLFDEQFFMYGEDVDLSYRFLKAGYFNYYFPGISIVHHKGKSTSRNSYTDILHFYNAMRIYVIKHNICGKCMPVRLIILTAISLREGLALLNRFIRITFR